MPELPEVETARRRMHLTGRKAPIKGLLLDQRLFPGVGNWIADEVLYQACIAPHRPGNQLSMADLAALRACLRRILHKAVEVGADASRFPKTWLFHHRWGKNPEAVTSRGETVRFATLGGRTTAWVPDRQV